MTHFYVTDVEEFADKIGLPRASPALFARDLHAFRARFCVEELAELMAAFAESDLPSYLDALVDLDYVLVGTAIMAGAARHFSAAAPIDQEQLVKRGYSLRPRVGPGRTADVRQPRLPTLSEHLKFASGACDAVASVFDSLARDEENAAGRDWPETPREGHPVRSMLSLHRDVVLHAVRLGLDYSEAWDRIHAANMRKERVLRAEDGPRGSTYDALKPEGWRPADLGDLCRPRDG